MELSLYLFTITQQAMDRFGLKRYKRNVIQRPLALIQNECMSYSTFFTSRDNLFITLILISFQLCGYLLRPHGIAKYFRTGCYYLRPLGATNVWLRQRPQGPHRVLPTEGCTLRLSGYLRRQGFDYP